MRAAHLFLAQRISAMILAPLVLVHLGLIVYAMRGGLSAAEILARTQGSALWAAFYGLFVVAAAVHAAIGVRTMIAESFGWRGRMLDGLTLAVGLGLFGLGARAVAAVVL